MREGKKLEGSIDYANKLKNVELGVLEKVKWKDRKSCLESGMLEIKTTKMLLFIMKMMSSRVWPQD